MSGARQGDRVELVRCTDQYTDLEPGARGRVSRVDEHGIHVLWDSGSSLSLLPDEGDEYRVIPPAAVPDIDGEIADQEASYYERTALGRDFREP